MVDVLYIYVSRQCDGDKHVLSEGELALFGIGGGGGGGQGCADIVLCNRAQRCWP